MLNKKLLITVPLFVIFFFISISLFSPFAHASVLDSIVNGIKNLATSNAKSDGNGQLTIDANINLAPDGDANKNGSIDEGDIIRFTYIIKNDSKNNYPFAVLKTNLDRKSINFIHNLQGAYSLNDKNGTVELPNLYIHAHRQLSISFDARLFITKGVDQNISTQAQMFDKNGNKIIEIGRIELKAKALSLENIKSLFNLKNEKVQKH